MSTASAKTLLTQQWHERVALLTQQWHGRVALLAQQWHGWVALLTQQWYGCRLEMDRPDALVVRDGGEHGER